VAAWVAKSEQRLGETGGGSGASAFRSWLRSVAVAADALKRGETAT
jgi:hypothetical protein